MSNYIPRHAKKKEHLARREQDLLRVLTQGQAGQKLIDAAEEVRAAMLRVVEAKRAMVPPHCGHELEIAKLDAESHKWASMHVEDIISEYRQRSAKLRHRAEQISPAVQSDRD